MKRILYTALMALALTSCAEDINQSIPATAITGEEAEVQLTWTVADMTAGDELTRAALATRTIPTDMDAGGTYDDIAPTVQNMWIIQFDGTTPASKIVGAPRYLNNIDLPTGAYPLTVSVPLAQSTVPVYTLYVANIRQQYNWNFTAESTFAEVITRVKTLLSEADSYQDFDGYDTGDGKTLLMSAVTSTPIQAGTPLTPVFLRNVAKVTLNLTLSNPDMTITSVRMRNVSNRIVYADAALAANGVTPTTIYPVDVALLSYDAVTTGMPANGETKAFSWYVPRNQQGVGTALTAADKNRYAPMNATFFEVTATKGGANPVSTLYRVYPGADLVSDFNLEANHEYTVNLTVTDADTDPNDTRVESFADVDYSGPGTPGAKSNSFILNPAPVGGATRTYRIGIDQVNRYWGGTLPGYGNNPANMIAAGDAWQIDLVWVDLPTLFSATPSATAITLADNNGLGIGAGQGPEQTFLLNVPANLPAGNFLLGIKKAGNPNYLWSWHFWVTDYNPDTFNKSIIAAGRYTYPVPGGQVERYGSPATGIDLWSTVYADNVMMDRMLGAVETNFTTTTTLNMRGLLYYQFGRKDPIPSATTLAPHAYATTAGPVAISESVLSPWTFYTVAAGNWTNSPGSDATIFSWNDPASTNGSKSIYDPCPPGWQVPTNGTWNDFNRKVDGKLTNVLNLARDLGLNYGRGIGTPTKFVNGVRYWPGTTGTDPVEGTIFYATTATRNQSTGAIVNQTVYTYCWSATLSTALYGYALWSTSGDIITLSNMTRAVGLTVRCVSGEE